MQKNRTNHFLTPKAILNFRICKKLDKISFLCFEFYHLTQMLTQRVMNKKDRNELNVKY